MNAIQHTKKVSATNSGSAEQETSRWCYAARVFDNSLLSEKGESYSKGSYIQIESCTVDKVESGELVEIVAASQEQMLSNSIPRETLFGRYIRWDKEDVVCISNGSSSRILKEFTIVGRIIGGLDQEQASKMYILPYFGEPKIESNEKFHIRLK